MVNRGEEGGETVHGCWLLHPTPPLNPAVAPFGRGLTVRVTGCVGPFTRPTVIVLLPDPPGEPIEISPVFDKEKSKPATPTFKEHAVGIEEVVKMVRRGIDGGEIVQVGWLPQPTPPLNPGVAPVGRPVTESATG